MNLGPYQLIAQTGAGADGVAYRAVNTKDGQAVEVRVLSNARADASRWKPLTKRLRLTALLAHPATLHVHELNLQHAPPFVVVEGPGDGPLDALAASLPLPVPRAVEIVRNMAAGLAEGHRLGLTHGPLRPTQLRGHVEHGLKLDFSGIETQPTPPEEAAALDAAFRAPEANGDASPGFGTDVFSVGCLLFWLLTGRLPAPGALGPDDAGALRSLEPDESRPLERLIEQARATEPGDRPSAKEIEDRLAALRSILRESQQPAGAESAARSAERAPPEVALPTPRPSQVLARGQLGRYRLLEMIGEGGMGTVYRAEDTVDGSTVAIKVLRSELTSRTGALRRFQKEARLLSEVKHPNVANLLEVNEDDGIHFLVLEFIAGKNLADDLDERRHLDERPALTILAEVARALEDAHERGIVHRDIKPANIVLLDAQAQGSQTLGLPRVKLLDFGLARHVVESASLDVTRPGAVLGTPLYMAPEQWTQGATDPRTDVYALGATLFHLLAGRPPFEADSSPLLMALHCRQPPPAVQQFNPAVSDAACQLVAKCLAKSPDERYADAGALLRDLERLLRGEPTTIIVHPRLPACDPRKIVQFDWVLDLQATPAQLWPYISNTERLNRAVGLPSVQFTAEVEPGFGVRRYGRFRKAGFTNTWEEHPFEWIEGRQMGVLREYSQGVFKWLATMTELEPRAEGGTRLTHRVRIEPAGLMGRLVAAFEVGVRGRKTVEQVYRRIDAYLTTRLSSAALADPFEESAQPSRTQRRELERLAQQLPTDQVEPAVVETIVDFLAHAPEQELARIRPLVLARRLGLDPSQVLAACLHGARQGLFMLFWDIICPICRIPSEVKDSLRSLREHANCVACNRGFEVDFAQSVELIFRAHPDIRTTDLGTYCVGGPVHSPHVVAQARVNPGERIELNLALTEGAYRLRGPQLPWALDFHVRQAAPASRWDVSLARGLDAEYPPHLRPGRQTLALTNDAAQELLVRIERAVPRADALTAARASSLALFRELFPTEVLAPGQLISVATLTFLVTRLEGARSLYQELGDARAFAQVHEHVRRLEQCIRREGGALVKIVGEGIVASFTQSSAAVRAALAFPKALAGSDHAGMAQLHVGIHRGPAMVATINEQLDYFGSTIHLASQLLDLARAGELILTHPVAADPAVAALLQGQASSGELVEVELPDQPMGLAQRYRLAEHDVPCQSLTSEGKLTR